MLPCERAHPPLSRADFARALPYFLADYVRVMRHVVRTPSWYPPHLTSMQELYDYLLHYDIPPPALLNRVVSYVLFQLDYKSQTEPLTPDEEHIVAAAWRLSDSMHGPRDTH
jgi:hypothetical protein